MGKVLEFRTRSQSHVPFVDSMDQSVASEPLNIADRREAQINAERRQVRRTILTEFVSVHAIVSNYGLMRIALYDINTNGLAFDMELSRGAFTEGEEIPLRVYLNHKTYFPFTVKVKHTAEIEDEAVVRHGCEFVKGTLNDIALQHFVGFIENVCASLREDKGDVLVSQIKS